MKGDKARGDKAMGENRNCLLYMTLKLGFFRFYRTN